MSKKSKRGKKGKSVKINFKGVETRKLCPDGDYPLVVKEVSQEEGDKAPYWSWLFQVNKGDHKGVQAYHNTSLAPQALWNLKNVLEALGMEVPDSSLEVKLSELPDLECGATLERTTWENKSKMQIVDFFPLDDLEDDEDDDDEDDDDEEDDDKGKEESDDDEEEEEDDEEDNEEITEEEIKGMSSDELDELVDDNEIDVDLEGIKGIKKKRQAVIDALSEDDDEDDDEEDSDELNEEEVKAANTARLNELIEDNELDEDLVDVKPVKKKRREVIKALKKADLL